MVVYIVSKAYGYDSPDTVGVYATRDSAEFIAREYGEDDRLQVWITEWEVL